MKYEMTTDRRVDGKFRCAGSPLDDLPNGVCEQLVQQGYAAEVATAARAAAKAYEDSAQKKETEK